MSTTEHPVSGVEESDPDTLTILFVTVIGTLLVAIVVLVLQGLYEGVQQAEIRKKVVDEVPQELHALRVAQLEKLSGSSWVDQAHGVIRMPIERAMSFVVRDPAVTAVPPPAASPAPSRPAETSPASTPAAGGATKPGSPAKHSTKRAGRRRAGRAGHPTNSQMASLEAGSTVSHAASRGER